MRRAIKLSTPNEVRKALSKVLNEVLNNRIDTKVANTFIVGCNAILGSIRVDDQDKRLAELERTLEELTNKDR